MTTGHRGIELSHGSTRRNQIELEDLTLTEAVFAPDYHLDEHYHSIPTMTLVLDGAFTETQASRRLVADKFSLLIKPADLVHVDHIEPSGVRSILIEVRSPQREKYSLLGEFFETPCVHRNAAIKTLARTIHQELERAEEDKLSRLMLEGLTLQLFSEAARVKCSSRRHQRPPRWLQRVIDYVNDSPTDDLSLTTIAQRAGVHPSHLSRVFRQHHGCSIGQYARRIRLEHAARLLRETDKALCEIASVCGFSDQSHFTSAFKRWSGSTPGRYRNAA
ncbi:MAG: AraC family transcriptional regulator [Myxococcota bacterium]